jgi:magnesium-transporting ATPase (P-type)
MTVSLKEIWVKGWPLAAGIAIAVMIINTLQMLSPLAYSPNELADSMMYSLVVEQLKPVQVRNELLGLVLAIVTLLSILTPSLVRSAFAPLLAYTPFSVPNPSTGSFFAWAFILGLVIVGVLLLYTYLRHNSSLSTE